MLDFLKTKITSFMKFLIIYIYNLLHKTWNLWAIKKNHLFGIFCISITVWEIDSVKKQCCSSSHQKPVIFKVPFNTYFIKKGVKIFIYK